MMTDQTDSASRQDTITDAASNAYWRMRQAAIEIAEAGGAEVYERPIFPGAISVSRYAEPLAGHPGRPGPGRQRRPDPPRVHPARSRRGDHLAADRPGARPGPGPGRQVRP